MVSWKEAQQHVQQKGLPTIFSELLLHLLKMTVGQPAQDAVNFVVEHNVVGVNFM